jgi:hypothetical protein
MGGCLPSFDSRKARVADRRDPSTGTSSSQNSRLPSSPTRSSARSFSLDAMHHAVRFLGGLRRISGVVPSHPTCGDPERPVVRERAPADERRVVGRDEPKDVAPARTSSRPSAGGHTACIPPSCRRAAHPVTLALFSRILHHTSDRKRASAHSITRSSIASRPDVSVHWGFWCANLRQYGTCRGRARRYRCWRLQQSR